MRLLRQNDQGELVFTDDLHEPPPYAVLSHTWGRSCDEVNYQDIIDGTAQAKGAYFKIRFMVEQTKKKGLDHFWVDTCCINQRNDAELATAIRSMFRWYRESAVCFVYLSDVSLNKRKGDGALDWEDAFRLSRWFTRGWTLQELLAPKQVDFYARGQYVGRRSDLEKLLCNITGIDMDALQGRPLELYPFLTRLQWASGRKTTVPEDGAYALMGLCGVVIDPRYGEGLDEASRRLRREITDKYGDVALDRTVNSVPANLKAYETHEALVERRQTKMGMLHFHSIDSRKTTIKKALNQTCSWILTHPAYQAWREKESVQQHNGFLWIKGKPGAGKSVLVKYLDNYISRNSDRRDIHISFYFNARGEQLERSLVGMYRSLLSQLLQLCPSSQDVLDNARHLAGETDTAIEELQGLFLTATLKLKERRLLCFIDALDECREQDVQQMVDFFQSLGQEAMDEGIAVNVCFASRHYPTLNIITGLQLVLEDVNEHVQDLSKYVRSQKFPIGTKGNTERIPTRVQEEILAKANGVFLWVVLVVEILKKEYQSGRIHAVNKRLSEIPKGLHELFRDILLRDRENIDEFILCLKWILYAKRPLALTEFYFAMMAGIHDQPLKWSPEITMDLMHGFLLSSSKGLAEPTKGNPPRAQFIHESVRDFLITGEGFKHIEQDHHTSVGETHEILKQCCLRSVMTDLTTWRQETDLDAEGRDSEGKAWKPSTSKEKRQSLIERFPFLDYATNFILYHSDQAANDVSQLEFIQSFDLNNWVNNANLLQKHDINLYAKPIDMIHICAERDCARLLRVSLKHGHEPRQNKLQRNCSPLFAAFANKSKDAALVLLEQEGATSPDRIVQEVIVDSYGGRATFDRQKTRQSWLWAIEQGLESLAMHLLRAHCNARDDEHGTALQNASQKGLKRLTAMLLKDGADVNARGGRFPTALQAASIHCNIHITKMLLENDADTNARSQTNLSPIWAALIGGHVEVVQMLLSHGADVEDLGVGFCDALYQASKAGWIEAVKVLIHLKVDVNAQSGYYGNALQAASCLGHSDIVKLLLGQGSNINAQGGHLGTALQAACAYGRLAIADLLLNNGAEINAQGGYLGNALQAASCAPGMALKPEDALRSYQLQLMLLEQQNKKRLLTARQAGDWVVHDDKVYDSECQFVKLLLDRGADVNAQGGHFGNALQAASDRGDLDIVELLLDRGANVNAQGGYYSSALHAACTGGFQRITKLLLDRDANVNAPGGEHGSALHAASARGDQDIVNLLLDRGADVNAQGGFYSNALEAAFARGHKDIAELLLDRGANYVAHIS